MIVLINMDNNIICTLCYGCNTMCIGAHLIWLCNCTNTVCILFSIGGNKCCKNLWPLQLQSHTTPLQLQSYTTPLQLQSYTTPLQLQSYTLA